jgi:short-subunit dehydrogenase
MRSLIIFLSLIFSLLILLNIYFQPTIIIHRDKLSSQAFQQKYGKWAVVAGASQGLGRAWVLALAQRGLNIIALARNMKELEVTKDLVLKKYPTIQVELVFCDLADSNNAQSVVNRLAQEKEIGMLVYNAAGGAPGLFVEQDFKYHKLTFDVNVYSMLAFVHTLAKPMVQRKRGGIILVSSMAGEAGNAMVSTYSGSKALITTFGEAIWWELQSHNIDVLVPILGATTTKALEVMKIDLRKEKLIEQAPEDVVSESMHALGRGYPSLATGWFNKFAWALARYLPVPVMVNLQNSEMKDVYKDGEELKKITEQGFKSTGWV